MIPQGDRHLQDVLIDRNDRVGDAASQTLGNFSRRAAVGIGQKDYKFITAVAADDIRFPQVHPALFSSRPQKLVTG